MNKKFFFTCLFVLISLTPSCERSPGQERGENGLREELTAFEYRRSAPDLNLVITGEAAVMETERETSVVNPSGVIETSRGRMVRMETSPEGEAVITFDEVDGRISTLILTGDVRVETTNKATGEVEMRAESERLEYDYEKQLLFLEGNPVVFYGRNEFRGEKISYHINEGRIHIEKSASGLIYLENDR